MPSTTPEDEDTEPASKAAANKGRGKGKESAKRTPKEKGKKVAARKLEKKRASIFRENRDGELLYQSL